MIEIPTIATGLVHGYEQAIRLDGTFYRVRIVWNARIDHWTFSLYTANKTPIAQGRVIVNGLNLLSGCVSAYKPPGSIFATPTDGRNVHAGLTGLGSRVRLYYLEEADL